MKNIRASLCLSRQKKETSTQATQLNKRNPSRQPNLHGNITGEFLFPFRANFEKFCKLSVSHGSWNLGMPFPNSLEEGNLTSPIDTDQNYR
jgi:hypothetical protein